MNEWKIDKEINNTHLDKNISSYHTNTGQE